MDFSKPGMAEHVAATIRNEIDDNSAADNPPKYRWRVSPSSLGKECVAQQWFKFRWVSVRQVPGPIARLFARGNKEEGNIIALLRRAGWEIRDYDKRLCYIKDTDTYFAQEWEASIVHGVDVSADPVHIAAAKARDKWMLRQYRVKDLGGHYSGYLDGKARHPIHTGGEWVLLELKTYKSRLFSTLVARDKEGNLKTVQVHNYDYYCQAVQYMDYHQLPWCLFGALNKDDDDLYFECIPANPQLAHALKNTAHTIATSQARPARIAESPTFHKCKICDFTNICHKSAPVDINCRSCQHCVAEFETNKGNFRCNKWAAIIPDEKAIMAACPQHLPLV